MRKSFFWTFLLLPLSFACKPGNQKTSTELKSNEADEEMQVTTNCVKVANQSPPSKLYLPLITNNASPTATPPGQSELKPFMHHMRDAEKEFARDMAKMRDVTTSGIPSYWVALMKYESIRKLLYNYLEVYKDYTNFKIPTHLIKASLEKVDREVKDTFSQFSGSSAEDSDNYLRWKYLHNQTGDVGAYRPLIKVHDDIVSTQNSLGSPSSPERQAHVCARRAELALNMVKSVKTLHPAYIRSQVYSGELKNLNNALIYSIEDKFRLLKSYFNGGFLHTTLLFQIQEKLLNAYAAQKSQDQNYAIEDFDYAGSNYKRLIENSWTGNDEHSRLEGEKKVNLWNSVDVNAIPAQIEDLFVKAIEAPIGAFAADSTPEKLAETLATLETKTTETLKIFDQDAVGNPKLDEAGNPLVLRSSAPIEVANSGGLIANIIHQINLIANMGNDDAFFRSDNILSIPVVRNQTLIKDHVAIAKYVKDQEGISISAILKYLGLTIVVIGLSIFNPSLGIWAGLALSIYGTKDVVDANNEYKAVHSQFLTSINENGLADAVNLDAAHQNLAFTLLGTMLDVGMTAGDMATLAGKIAPKIEKGKINYTVDDLVRATEDASNAEADTKFKSALSKVPDYLAKFPPRLCPVAGVDAAATATATATASCWNDFITFEKIKTHFEPLGSEIAPGKNSIVYRSKDLQKVAVINKRLFPESLNNQPDDVFRFFNYFDLYSSSIKSAVRSYSQQQFNPFHLSEADDYFRYISGLYYQNKIEGTQMRDAVFSLSMGLADIMEFKGVASAYLRIAAHGNIKIKNGRAFIPKFLGFAQHEGINIGLILDNMPGDNVLSKIRSGTLNKNHVESIKSQITEALAVLHANNFTHGDFHLGQVLWDGEQISFIDINVQGTDSQSIGYLKEFDVLERVKAIATLDNY